MGMGDRACALSYVMSPLQGYDMQGLHAQGYGATYFLI